MTGEDHLAKVLAMLGEPITEPAPAADWQRAETAAGAALPEDYRIIVDRYAPVRLNHHLYLPRPGRARWNLENWIQETITAWNDVDWSGDDWYDDEAGVDPRLVLGSDTLVFGGPGGLIPLLGSDRGETVFFAPAAAGGADGQIFAEGGDGDFHHHPMPFAQWLYGYLTGANMTGPYSGILYEGPVQFASLPDGPGDPERIHYGPDRGM
ncbi:SMI1/KNR4 family protein [Streptomyces tsukubensis]|uniref:SMI1/KNR4 family protein n=1 Tax=Streptomyces tsukubensis TaxID=83656 RepID=UPI00368111CD